MATSKIDTDNVKWIKELNVKYKTDIAVIGGGIAGISAACAAAKYGRKVLLVERFGVVGGNSTVGGVAAFCGETRGQGEIFDEIIRNLEDFKAIAPYMEGKARVFDHEILAIVLQEMLVKYDVKLLLHTQLVDVIVKDGKISECIISGRSGPEVIRAKEYIDCSGEGVLAHLAGFGTMKGREQDGLQLPMSMMFFVRHVDEGQAVNQLPGGWFGRFNSIGDLPMTSIWPNGPRSNAIKIKIPMFDSTDTESMTKAEITARRRMMEVLEYYQRVEKKPWLLDHCSPQIGIREGRRVLCDYTLKVEDLRAGRRFADAIALGVFELDGHKPDDDKRTFILPKDQRYVPPYNIPLRCLIVKDSENLMVAGRCFSADQLALSSARVTTTCSMMGQAAGITAAICIDKKCTPRDVDALIVRKILEMKGAILN